MVKSKLPILLSFKTRSQGYLFSSLSPSYKFIIHGAIGLGLGNNYAFTFFFFLDFILVVIQ